MNAIKATWKKGRILPAEPVDWPEGSELLIQLLRPPMERAGLSEEDWRDEPEAIADWETWARNIEPLELSDDERADLARYREEHRQFNIEAVRRQMEAGAEP